MAGSRSTLSMLKIKVKISETKYRSFYKTLDQLWLSLRNIILWETWNKYPFNRLYLLCFLDGSAGKRVLDAKIVIFVYLRPRLPFVQVIKEMYKCYSFGCQAWLIKRMIHDPIKEIKTSNLICKIVTPCFKFRNRT